MKNILPVLILFLMSCSSVQISNNAPFKVNSIHYKSSSKILELTLKNPLPQDITLTAVYFRDTKVEWTKNTGKLIFNADFSINDRIERPLILHADPKKEFGNQPPVKKEKIPFELTDNECIISYIEKGETKFYKTIVTILE
jgi:hypothetical protein